MKAVWNKAVVAEASDDQLIQIGGVWYFPPEAVKYDYLRKSYRSTDKAWCGMTEYFDVVADDVKSEFGAWHHPEPLDGSIERIGKDFTNYVAFRNGVEVTS